MRIGHALLDEWREARSRAFGHCVLVVAAHPDDEVVGVGGALQRCRDAVVVHVTDGAPRDLCDARAAGFDTIERYAEARAREAEAALALAGVDADRLLRLEVPDQRAAFELVAVARTLADVVARLRPAVVVTHAYEGGHPDHDAARFATAAGIALAGSHARLVEMAGYHAYGAGTFLEDALGSRAEHARATRGIQLALTDDERATKARMLDAHRTQARVLAALRTTLALEPLRLAPRVDWSRPPHDGPLHYERHPWGIDGEGFRAHARDALASLGLERRVTFLPGASP